MVGISKENEARLTAEEARRRLRYDVTTGKLFWKRRSDKGQNWNSRWAGKLAGTVSRKQWAYVTIEIDALSFMAHRVIWLICNGEWPTGTLDHVNGDPTDNRIENLRIATAAQQAWNTRRKRQNTTGFKGVSLRESGRFRAVIFVNGKRLHLGTFATAEEAHSAYTTAAQSYFGDFARTG